MRPSVLLQQSRGGDDGPVAGPSVVVVAKQQDLLGEWVNQTGPWQSVLHSPYLGAGCFRKGESAGNLILPPVVGIFKGDGAGS